MTIINEQIENTLRNNFKDKKRVRLTNKNKNNVYNFSTKGKIGEEIEIILSSKAVCANMQDDIAAFEAWSLIFIRYNIAKTIKLKWEEPEKKDYHYNRFLFRVKCFKLLFDWISIDVSNHQSLLDFDKVYNSELFINEPSGKRKDEHVSQGEEAILEKYIVENCANKISNTLGLNIRELKRQLPVGLFQNCVSNDNRIFSGGKSAIDFYGVDYDKKTIVIFELKCKNNKKVGILSELLFYTMFIIGILQRKFIYDNSKTGDLKDRLSIDEIEIVKACFLVHDMHPLIDPFVIDLLNQAFKKQIATITSNRVKEVSFLEVNYEIGQIGFSLKSN